MTERTLPSLALAAILLAMAGCGHPPTFPEEPPEGLVIEWQESTGDEALCFRVTTILRDGRTTVETPGGHRTRLELPRTSVDSVYDLIRASDAARLMHGAVPRDGRPGGGCEDGTWGKALDVTMQGRRYTTRYAYDPGLGVLVQGSEAERSALDALVPALDEAAGLPR
jgi:hypothetical protein